MQNIISQGKGYGVTIPDAVSGLFEVDVPGGSWDVWYGAYSDVFYVRKNGGKENTLYSFPTVKEAVEFINRTTENNMDTSGHFWDKARVNEDGSIYLGYAAIVAYHEATIRYLADGRAERLHGVNSYAEIVGFSGDVYTFKFITIPSITVGYGTYDASRNAWID
jgi:hypothetical protein